MNITIKRMNSSEIEFLFPFFPLCKARLMNRNDQCFSLLCCMEEKSVLIVKNERKIEKEEVEHRKKGKKSEQYLEGT